MTTVSFHTPVSLEEKRFQDAITQHGVTTFGVGTQRRDTVTMRFTGVTQYSDSTGRTLRKKPDDSVFRDLSVDEQQQVLSVKERMVDNVPEKRMAVIRELTTDRQRIALIRMTQLNTNDWRLPLIGMDVIATLEDDLLKAYFIDQAMTSSIPSLPQNATFAIRYINDNTVKRQVIETGLNHKNRLVQGHASGLFTAIRNQSELAFLIRKGLTHDNVRVKANAAKVLNQINDAPIHKKLLRLAFIANLNATDYTRPLAGLQNYPDDLVLDPSFLIEGLTHNAHSVRSAFLKLLTHRLNDENYDELKTLLVHTLLSPTNPEIADYSGHVLETITSPTLCFLLAKQYKDHPNVNLKLSILDIVKDSGDSQLLHHVVMDLFENSAYAKQSAVLAIRRIEDDRLKATCIERVLSDPSSKLKRRVCPAINSLEDDGLKVHFIKKLLALNLLTFKDPAMSAINSLKDESIKAKLIRHCLSGYSNAVELDATRLIRGFKNDAIKSSLIKDAMQHSNTTVVVIAAESLASIKQDDIKLRIIQDCLTDSYPSYVKAIANKTIASLSSDVLKIPFIINYLAKPDENQSHLAMARAIGSLTDESKKSEMMALAFEKLADADLQEACKAIDFFEDETIQSMWMMRAIEHDDKVIHNMGMNVLRQKQLPNLDPVKEVWIKKHWSFFKDYDFNLITSLQDETLKNRWIHLGLLSPKEDVRKKALLLVNELKNSNFRQQWKQALIDNYGVEAN